MLKKRKRGMFNWFNKHREGILYLVFGVLTTLVNFLVFLLFSWVLDESFYLVSNLIAWVAAVIFAFVVNKIFVFNEKSWRGARLLREIGEFVGARVFSLAVEEVGLVILVDLSPLGDFSAAMLGFNITGQIIAKLILAVAVIVMNYFFSKFIIFKKDNEGDGNAEK